MQLGGSEPMQTETEASKGVPSTRNIRGALALASLSLLAGQAQALEPRPPWEVDSRLLIYNESDRVKVLKGMAKVIYTPDEDRSYGLTVGVDTMTGASPNGAIPSDQPQTFTRPSGAGVYTTPANRQPLDDGFRDTRVSLVFDAMRAINSNLRFNYAIQASHEYDYQSYGISLGLERDFNLHNTTLALNLSGNFDTSKPVGGIPEPLAYMPSHPALKRTLRKSDTKKVLDVQVSLTQLLSPQSLIRTSLVVGMDDGYINDPYKIVSIVDSASGALFADPERRYIFESRPDRKSRWAWHTAYQRQLDNEDVLHLSYRLYKDDWGTLSHTLDTSYRFQVTPRHFLEPHLRYYRQGAADFYRTSLPSDQNLPNVSADYRLADLRTYTVGLTWGFDLGDRRQLRFGAEYYRQQADPSQIIGVQHNQTLIEDTKVFMVRMGYAIQW